MALHVSRSFSLKSIPVIALRPPAPRMVVDPCAALAAQFIPAGARVLDLSFESQVRRLLPEYCDYRTGDALGGGLAQAAANADIVVMLGLEGIADPDALFVQLSAAKPNVILSYRARDLGGESAGPLSFFDLTILFDRHGFRIECTAPAASAGTLMRLIPAERLMPISTRRVAVIAEGEGHGFGDRLGRAMLQSVLPGEAEIDYLNLATLGDARTEYDLVVLGTGGGLTRPLIDDRVFEIVDRAKATVGIFGIRYRELIPPAALDRLLERLDTWYARYQDDVLIYGRGRSNVVHLGDWSVDCFPLAAGSVDEPLRVTASTPSDSALDYSIARIQRHRRVYSEQLRPLLCALTAAETAAYAERPTDALPGAAPGQFRSMLIDIFGRSYPEKEYFLIDRDAVTRYKARVHNNVTALRRRIETLLGNAAGAAA
jgi:hypothetical protein